MTHRTANHITRNATTGAEYIRLFVICAAAIGLACLLLPGEF